MTRLIKILSIASVLLTLSHVSLAAKDPLDFEIPEPYKCPSIGRSVTIACVGCASLFGAYWVYTNNVLSNFLNDWIGADTW